MKKRIKKTPGLELYIKRVLLGNPKNPYDLNDGVNSWKALTENQRLNWEKQAETAK